MLGDLIIILYTDLGQLLSLKNVERELNQRTPKTIWNYTFPVENDLVRKLHKYNTKQHDKTRTQQETTGDNTSSSRQNTRHHEWNTRQYE